MRTFLSLNHGSSSLKFALFEEERLVFKDGIKTKDLKDFEKALLSIKSRLEVDPYAIAHRVVHGMDHKGPMPINQNTLPLLKELADINPLHNAIAFHCISFSLGLFPQSKHYALFDTDFHKSLPEYAQLYGINLQLYKRGIKRYGFHGISYSYLLERSKEILKKEKPNLIMMHLGAGCSICAIKGGVSVDTSMGFSPLEGLLMATRPGDLDAGVVLQLLKEGYTAKDIEDLFYHNSGLKGLWGKEDFKELIESMEKDPMAKLTFDVFLYRLLKYVGAYWFVLGGMVDALVFSGGIGENSPQLRLALCERLKPFGVLIDYHKNEEGESIINTEESKVKVLVLKTDEELQMVRLLRQTLR